MRCARDFEQTLVHVQNVSEVYYCPYGGRHIGNSEVDDVIMLFLVTAIRGAFPD